LFAKRDNPISKTNLIKENIYGHGKRLGWIMAHINKSDSIVEFGCGTGYMITLPLAKQGYTVYGIDLDKDSIVFGKEIFQQAGLDPNKLVTLNIVDFEVTPNIIIASEVLEHIPNQDMVDVLSVLRTKLKPGGQLLVTVPNGYGWFEFESFVWFKLRLGYLLERLRIVSIIQKLRSIDVDNQYPSTLASSPHVQRFTYSSIQKLMRGNGFEVVSITGSVLFAGPFSNLLFSGFNSIMKLNAVLGHLFPRIASGFFIVCKVAN